MKTVAYIFILMLSINLYGASKNRKFKLITKEEYYAKGKPCACPGDKKRDKKTSCGDANTAYCKGGGDNISNCYEPIIKTPEELMKQRAEHCPI